MIQTPTDPALEALGRSIQMAIAPVFLLSGVAAFLNVLNSRLLRVVDRTRALFDFAEEDAEAAREMVLLLKRRHAINRAITLCTVCALLICFVIVLMFLGIVVHASVVYAVSVLFIMSMVALIIALMYFLHEVHMAVRFFRRRPLR